MKKSLLFLFCTGLFLIVGTLSESKVNATAPCPGEFSKYTAPCPNCAYNNSPMCFYIYDPESYGTCTPGNCPVCDYPGACLY